MQPSNPLKPKLFFYTLMSMTNENKCAKCGACSVVCPVYQASGRESMTARGKLHLISRLDPGRASRLYAEILSKCLLCGACSAVCSRQLDPPAIFAAARHHLNRKAGEHRFLRSLTCEILGNEKMLQKIAGINRRALDALPEASGLRLRFGLGPGTGLAASIEVGAGAQAATDSPLNYFTGCYAGHLNLDIAKATKLLAQKATASAPATSAAQCCCGLPAHSAGDLTTARALAKKNIAAFAFNPNPILTSCASCYSHLLSYPHLLADDPRWQKKAQDFTGRLLEFSSFFQQKKDSLFFRPPGSDGADNKIYYHDPCHLRFQHKITEPPRQLLRRLPGFIPVEPEHGATCCGQGGLFHLAQPELSATISDKLITGIQHTNASLVTTTCTGCLLQLSREAPRNNYPVAVKHLAVLLAENLT